MSVPPGLIEYIEKLFGAAGMPDSVDYLRQILRILLMGQQARWQIQWSRPEKYAEQVEGALKNRYFQYLFEMVQAGENTIDQKNRVLHKVVDETWLKVIEEGIDAIFKDRGQAAQVHHDIGGGRAGRAGEEDHSGQCAPSEHEHAVHRE